MITASSPRGCVTTGVTTRSVISRRTTSTPQSAFAREAATPARGQAAGGPPPGPRVPRRRRSAPAAGRSDRGGPAAALGEQVQEFKQMVKALHREGIEVILDVVYNHTAEGNHLGPTL